MSDRQLSSSQGETGPVSLPGPFLTEVISGTRDLAELKTVLSAAYLILGKRDHPECVTYRELKEESRRLATELNEETLRRALDSAVEHGALLHSTSEANGTVEEIYSLPFTSGQPPSINIFSLYEQNIGLITPMIAEELKDAEKTYPPEWIEDAFKEAVALNKRSWRYIARILERWGTEGKDSGEHRRNTKKDGPDKYVRGRYGHLVKR